MLLLQLNLFNIYNDLGNIKFRNNSNIAQYTLDGSTWVNFKNPVGSKSISSNGTYDVSDYASAVVSVANTNSGTYTFPANDTGGTKDLGTTNTYRYVNAGNVYNKGKTDAINGAKYQTNVRGHAVSPTHITLNASLAVGTYLVGVESVMWNYKADDWYYDIDMSITKTSGTATITTLSNKIAYKIVVTATANIKFDGYVVNSDYHMALRAIIFKIA